MNKNYDKTFQDEVMRLLNELYYNPIEMSGIEIKRAVLKTEKRYVDYLLKHELVSNLNTANGGEWGLQLESNGYEVFEKYKGWYDYKSKVIDAKTKIEKAKNLAAKYWWLPILLSLISLIVSIYALNKKGEHTPEKSSKILKN